jgi:cytochrome c
MIAFDWMRQVPKGCLTSLPPAEYPGSRNRQGRKPAFMTTLAKATHPGWSGRDEDTVAMKIGIALAAGFGVIVLAASAAPLGQAQTAPNGQALFQQRCAMCHQTVAGRPATVGPNLAGVVGRRAAQGTFNFSPALRGSNLTWTRANLDRYLTAPARMVPGTRMAVSIPNAQQRAAIIDHLSRQR